MTYEEKWDDEQKQEWTFNRTGKVDYAYDRHAVDDARVPHRHGISINGSVAVTFPELGQIATGDLEQRGCEKQDNERARLQVEISDLSSAKDDQGERDEFDHPELEDASRASGSSRVGGDSSAG